MMSWMMLMCAVVAVLLVGANSQDAEGCDAATCCELLAAQLRQIDELKDGCGHEMKASLDLRKPPAGEGESAMIAWGMAEGRECSSWVELVMR